MKPSFGAGPDFVNASYQSVYGLIRSDWKKETDGLTWQITVPANTKAIVYIPAKNAGDVMESLNHAEKSEGVHFINIEDGIAVFEIGSGKYSFFVQSSAVK